MNISTTSHPDVNGQAERMNQIVEDLLWSYCSKESKKWLEYRSLVEFAYNSSYHSAINWTPFEALYGHECHTPLSWYDPIIKADIIMGMFEYMEFQRKLIQESMRGQNKGILYA